MLIFGGISLEVQGPTKNGPLRLKDGPWSVDSLLLRDINLADLDFLRYDK